jgi:ABC-type ATPase with predicted acetyltransferase domain
MFEFDVETCIDFPTPQTKRARKLMHMFGVRPERIKHQRLRHHCCLEVYPGDIIYLTGASGGGKTVMLDAMYEQIDEQNRLRLDSIELTDAVPVIDCMDKPVFASTEAFSRGGLGDVFCMLQTPAALSVGQQHRYRLAIALARQEQFIFADEFTSSLDRITAASVAHHLRKHAYKSDKIFILASSHEDILRDLLPDILIIKNLTGRTQTLYKNKNRDPANQYVINGKRYPVFERNKE